MPKPAHPHTHPLPIDCLASHTAILGKTGSGKTSTTKLMVEYLVAAGERVCIIDPIKSDYFGLTSSADGQSAGLPFQILGGPHGHVPLHAAAGKAVGELVATGALPLSIIDMADFGPGGHSEFFVDFAQAMLRKAKGVVYLVIEEAHIFAPKVRAGFDHETLSLHYTNKLATAGRSKGIRLFVCTQRTQKLHNDVLSSCETLIAHRTTFPADQKPILEWLTAKCSKDKAREVAESIASLKTGEAWICSGELNILDRHQFPKFWTYDNSRTPTSSDGEHHVRTAEVDRDALRSLIGEAVAEAEANDPKALREKVKALEDQLEEQRAMGNGQRAVGEEAVDAEELRTLHAAFEEMKATAEHACAELAARDQFIDTVLSWMSDRTVQFQQITEKFMEFPRVPDRRADLTARLSAPSPHSLPSPTGEMSASDREGSVSTLPAHRLSLELDRPVRTLPLNGTNGHAKPAEGDIKLTGAQQKILNALAWWKAINVREPVREAVATVSGYSASGGGFLNALGSLRTSGLIQYPSDGAVALTPAGCRYAHSTKGPQNLNEHHRAVLERLTGCEQKLLSALMRHYPRAMTREAIAKATGYSPEGGGFLNALGHLRTLALIDYPAKGTAVATDILFPHGLK